MHVKSSQRSPERQRQGSSVLQASLNFTNSTVGAGSVGFGGAIAQSGGLLSLSTIRFVGALTKVSCDTVVRLALRENKSSYEDLGMATFGQWGLAAVIVSKFLFGYGCLVAYVIIVKNNFATACRHLFSVDVDDNMAAVVLSTVVMLPLSLLRDLRPLARFSAMSIATYIGIILICTYFLFSLPRDDYSMGDFKTHWLHVHLSFIPNMGTFVFAFVTQHTVHLVYESLRTRTLETWKQVSLVSVGLATIIMMTLGIVVYVTFWEETESDMFSIYPAVPIVDVARILLCATIMLTYPMPFFSCRELIIISLPAAAAAPDGGTTPRDTATEEDLLLQKVDVDSRWWLVPDQERQLKGVYHVLLTVALWATSVALALGAPSLGDVLNVVGCTTGSLIAFILPSLFGYRIEGYTFIGTVLFVVGIFVGCIGTYYGLVDIIHDATKQ